MDMSAHEVSFTLAQAHWHHFRYRVGAMVGLDRARREVLVAPYVDDEGQQVTPQRVFGYDTLVVSVGSLSNDFGTPGVAEHAMKARDGRRRAALPHAGHQRLHPRPCAGHAAAPRAIEGGDHRRGRNRRRAGGGTAPHDARDGRFRAGPRRCRQGHPRQRDRSGAAGAAGAARRLSQATESLLTKAGVKVHTPPKVAEVLPGG